jgi:hypothetical protein
MACLGQNLLEFLIVELSQNLFGSATKRSSVGADDRQSCG